jgi:hypothetical protein
MNNIDNPQTKINFWEGINEVNFESKRNLENYLQEQWGNPLNEIQTNLLKELRNKIYSYYYEDENRDYAIYTLFGSVENISDIIEKKYKEGKRTGQTFYVLKIGRDKIKASQGDLSPEKWTQIEKFAILGQKLVFKYKKWITNNELLDFYPYKNEEPKLAIKNEIMTEKPKINDEITEPKTEVNNEITTEKQN